MNARPSPSTGASDTVLRDAGLRVTASRRAVYDALAELPHASADDIVDKIRSTLPTTSHQAVYNVLGDFVVAGLARRVEPAGQPGLFELRVGDNHHHLVCTSCGRVDDVDCVEGQAPCMHPDDTRGFQIHVAELTFWGLCPSCASPS